MHGLSLIFRWYFEQQDIIEKEKIRRAKSLVFEKKHLLKKQTSCFDQFQRLPAISNGSSSSSSPQSPPETPKDILNGFTTEVQESYQSCINGNCLQENNSCKSCSCHKLSNGNETNEISTNPEK